MNPRQIFSFLMRASVWVKDHGGYLAVAGVIFAAISFTSQLWQAQVSLSTSLYHSHVESDTVRFLKRLSFDWDEAVRNEKEDTYKLYIPILTDKITLERYNTRLHLSLFQKSMETLEQCYSSRYPRNNGFMILSGCDQHTIHKLIGEDIIDIFFTIRVYIYCDSDIKGIYSENRDGLERIVKESLEFESKEEERSGRERRVFRTKAQYEDAIDAERISGADPYVIVRIESGDERCNLYANY